MPIKKSFLETKWYYRLGKVFFILLPFLFVIFWFLIWKVDLPPITWKTWFLIIRTNLKNIFYFLLWVGAYYLILKWIRKLLLYIIFGWLDDDITKEGEMKEKQKIKKETITNIPVVSNIQPDNSSGTWIAIFFIIFIVWIFFVLFSQYNETLSTTSSNKSSSSTSSKPTTNTTQKNTVKYYCNPWYTYNFSSNKCCPSSSPYYYPGTHWIYQVGCYKTCPYVWDCWSRFQKF